MRVRRLPRPPYIRLLANSVSTALIFVSSLILCHFALSMSLFFLLI